MRPVEMNKMGLLAAAMYAVLEELKPQVSFSVTVGTLAIVGKAYDGFDKVITGYIVHGERGLLKFQVYVNTYGNLAVRVTGAETHYSSDTTRVEIHGNVEIDFKNKLIARTEEHEFGKEHALNWSWNGVKGTALDIIGSILGEQNPF